MKNKPLISFSLSLLISLSAFASPTIISERDQTFEQNDPPTQLRVITITEDSESAYIKEGTIRIKIPEILPIIFDQKRTISEVVVAYGTAVDSGKVDLNPDVSFEDKDRTIVIPINSDFTPGETLNLTKIYVKGFHEQPGSSARLTLHLNEEADYYTDVRNLYVRTSTNEDPYPPEIPTNIAVTDDEAGVKLSWIDPTDLDLQLIQILRGKNNQPISGTPYAEVVDGIQEYLDTDVQPGDTVKYILRATDGKNLSPNSTEISFIVGSSEPEIIEPQEPSEPEPPLEPAPIPDDNIMCTELYAPVCGVNNKTYSNSCKANLENISVAYQGECELDKVVPSDISNHWAKTYIIELLNRSLINGYPDGTFKPDASLNRAEAAKLLYRALYYGAHPSNPDQKPFTDVEANAWYAGYVSSLKSLNLINGNPDGTFEPSESINRAEFLTLALNTYYYWTTDERKEQVDNSRNAPKTTIYSDLEDSWYTATVSASTILGFVDGQICGSKKCFRASEAITRAEASKILFEMFFN